MNYWKAVLAALLLVFIVGGGSMAVGRMNSTISLTIGSSESDYNATYNANDYDIEDILGEDFYDDGVPALPPEVQQAIQEASQGSPSSLIPGFVLAGLFGVILMIALAIAILVDIFLYNPLLVGVRRFFSTNLHEKARARELAFSFDHSYRNIVRVMFYRDLHTFLWSLLFIIPGIVKSYEYRMIPYLLAEYPDMPKSDAFAISKYMMDGNKWKAFVLDLSFILWYIGSAVTLGLLGLFYATPYKAQTDASLYDALKAEKNPFHQPTLDNNGQQGYNEPMDQSAEA